MQFVLVNAIGGRKAGEVLDDVQNGPEVFSGLTSLGGILVALPNAIIEEAAANAAAAYAKGAGDEIANGIMLAAFGMSGSNDHLVLTDSTDIQPAFLADKMVAGTNIGFTPFSFFVGGPVLLRADVAVPPTPPLPWTRGIASGFAASVPGDGSDLKIGEVTHTTTTGNVVYWMQSFGSLTGVIPAGLGTLSLRPSIDASLEIGFVTFYGYEAPGEVAAGKTLHLHGFRNGLSLGAHTFELFVLHTAPAAAATALYTPTGVGGKAHIIVADVP